MLISPIIHISLFMFKTCYSNLNTVIICSYLTKYEKRIYVHCQDIINFTNRSIRLSIIERHPLFLCHFLPGAIRSFHLPVNNIQNPLTDVLLLTICSEPLLFTMIHADLLKYVLWLVIILHNRSTFFYGDNLRLGFPYYCSILIYVPHYSLMLHFLLCTPPFF